MPKVRPRHLRVWSPGGNANSAWKRPLHLASPPPQTPQRPAPFPTQTIEGRHLGPYQPCARDTSEGVGFGRADGNKKSIFLVPSENVYCQGGDPSEDSFAFGLPPPSSFLGTVFTLVQYTVFLPGSARSAKKSAGKSASEHRGVLGRVQVKGVGVGVADQVEVMPVQALHGRQEGAVLLRRARKRHGRTGQVGQRRAAGRAVWPGEGPWGRALREHGRLTRAMACELGPRWVQLIREIRLRERTQRLEGGLGAQAGLGLQEGEDARVLGVLGLHPLDGGEVMHQVLHALVVAVVEVVGKLR